MPGMLYLCATPIGNLEDMTYRAVRILKEVDIIAAEDTRNSIKLLNHFAITTPMTSYHEYNKISKGKNLIERMQTGENIALISDAGTPGISDPGEELVQMCHSAGIDVTVIPGACAAVAGLTVSGLPTRRFAFEAFLPTDKKEKRLILESLVNETRTIVLYEAPHRLLKTLGELKQVLGNREVSVCRELTKKHETVFVTTLAEAIEFYEANQPKGECVLAVAGKSYGQLRREVIAEWEMMTIKEHMAHYLEMGEDKKEAMKKVAKDRGISKRDVYREVLNM